VGLVTEARYAARVLNPRPATGAVKS
jgi:hypothetical protein